MKKLQFLLAAAAITFAGCSSDSYLGDEEFALSQETTGAIAFGGNAGRMVRATSNTGTVAEMLDHHFKVYGVKETATAGKFTDVFQNYAVWDNTTKTTSNPDGDAADADNKSRMNGWEYVGNGEAKGGLATQTIKYWDYSAPNYHFVAGSPAASFTYAKDANGDIATATVTRLAGHLNPNTGTAITTNPVYIADPVNVAKADYNKEVLLSFKRQQTFVRVGFFETIPGYSVTEIKFYAYDQANSKWGTTATDNITLASTAADYFMGATDGKATITYTWAPTPSYTFAYSDGTTKQNNWYGGALGTFATSTAMGTTSTAPSWGTDADMNATKYFTVIPSPSALTAQPLLIKCDYVLTADDGKNEKIKVSGATAAIPAAFCKWNPNTSYTYLFKISDNTNGRTGEDTDREGLYPITFDAAVIAEEDGTQQGTITTVSTPSITTYQEGSVTDEGIKYKKNKPIYFTAQNDETGVLNTLSELSSVVGYVEVYKLDGEKTEADLQLSAPTSGKVGTHVVTTEATYNNVTLPANKHAYFTPGATGWYAIQYQTALGVYTYKIVKVEE